MLSRTSRLTSPVDFQTTMRRGRRAGRRSLVVHLATDEASATEPRAGFVVSKAVGGAVQRNRVKRRLRHLCREELPSLPTGSLLVVRALPAAAESSYEELRADLRSGLDRATGAGARR